MPGRPTATVVLSRSRPFLQTVSARALRSMWISVRTGAILAAAAGIQPLRPFGRPGTLMRYQVGSPVCGSTRCESASTTCGRYSERNSFRTVTRRASARGWERTVTFELRWPEPTTWRRVAAASSRACAPGANAESASNATASALTRDGRLEGTDNTDSLRAAHDLLRHGDRNDAGSARPHEDPGDALSVCAAGLEDARALDDDLPALDRLPGRRHANHDRPPAADAQRLRPRSDRVAHDLLLRRALDGRSRNACRRNRPVILGVRLRLLADDCHRVRDGAGLLRGHDQRDRHRCALGDGAEVAADQRAAGAAPLCGRHRDEGRPHRQRIGERYLSRRVRAVVADDDRVG